MAANRTHYKPRDRFLKCCPIKYESRHLFFYLIEMEYVCSAQMVETFLRYPEELDKRFFKSDTHLKEYVNNVKKFAFPYVQTQANAHTTLNRSERLNSAPVQYFTFTFTDAEKVRQYGFCRAANAGAHVLCVVSYLPWHNVFLALLNKIAAIINEKDTTCLYNFLEAIYQYELPEPGMPAHIFSHDGLEQFQFVCEDRRSVPLINESKHLFKLLAFFELEEIIKIFTALLLERKLIVVSRDLENLSSCAHSLERFLYPLEWLHTFVPITPEHIDALIFEDPSPAIYGVHASLFEKLNLTTLEDTVVLLVDRGKVQADDQICKLPTNVLKLLTSRLNYFRTNGDGFGTAQKCDKLLKEDTMRAFLDAVLLIIGDYREYILLDPKTNKFDMNDDAFFKAKSVKRRSSNPAACFYHMFRQTQAFGEFWRDRADYLDAERKRHLVAGENSQFQQDFIDALIEQVSPKGSVIKHILEKVFEKEKEKKKRQKNSLPYVGLSNQIPVGNINTKDSLTSSQKAEPGDEVEQPSLNSFSSSSSTSSNASLSVQSSDLDTEKIRRVTSGKSQESKENRRAITEYSEFLNDPDILKLIGKNYEEKREEKLIDLSDSETAKSGDEYDNLTEKNLFIDQFDNVVNKPAKAAAKALNGGPIDVSFCSAFSSSLLLAPSTKQKQDSNQLESNKDATMRSIINEFDPISSKDSVQQSQLQDFSKFNQNPFSPAMNTKISNYNILQTPISYKPNILYRPIYYPAAKPNPFQPTTTTTTTTNTTNTGNPFATNANIFSNLVSDVFQPNPFQPNFQQQPTSSTFSASSNTFSSSSSLNHIPEKK